MFTYITSASVRTDWVAVMLGDGLRSQVSLGDELLAQFGVPRSLSRLIWSVPNGASGPMSWDLWCCGVGRRQRSLCRRVWHRNYPREHVDRELALWRPCVGHS